MSAYSGQSAGGVGGFSLPSLASSGNVNAAEIQQ